MGPGVKNASLEIPKGKDNEFFRYIKIGINNFIGNHEVLFIPKTFWNLLKILLLVL